MIYLRMISSVKDLSLFLVRSNLAKESKVFLALEKEKVQDSLSASLSSSQINKISLIHPKLVIHNKDIHNIPLNKVILLKATLNKVILLNRVILLNKVILLNRVILFNKAILNRVILLSKDILLKVILPNKDIPLKVIPLNRDILLKATLLNKGILLKVILLNIDDLELYLFFQ